MIQDTCPVCRTLQWSELLRTRDHFLSQESFLILECQNCGLKKTDPIPSKDTLGNYYKSEEYISHTDRKRSLTDQLYHLVRQRMLNQKRNWIRRSDLPAPNNTLLDFGCGTGYFAAFMKDSGYEVYGIESDPSAGDYAKDTFNLNVFRTLEELPEKKSFACITMWHVMEHIPDFNTLLAKLRSLLLPGGLLVIALPNPVSADAHHYKSHWAAWDVPRHLWHFPPGTVNQLMQHHNMSLLKTKRLPFDSFYVSILSERYKEKTSALPAGIWWGGISWLQSSFIRKKSSSLVYFYKKA